jgi:hypothetical protein
MPNCTHCGKPTPGKYCPGNACKNADWRLSRELGRALIEAGVVTRDEARTYIAVRKACTEAVCGLDTVVDGVEGLI